MNRKEEPITFSWGAGRQITLTRLLTCSRPNIFEMESAIKEARECGADGWAGVWSDMFGLHITWCEIDTQ